MKNNSKTCFDWMTNWWRIFKMRTPCNFCKMKLFKPFVVRVQTCFGNVCVGDHLPGRADVGFMLFLRNMSFSKALLLCVLRQPVIAQLLFFNGSPLTLLVWRGWVTWQSNTLEHAHPACAERNMKIRLRNHESECIIEIFQNKKKFLETFVAIQVGCGLFH